MLTGIHAAPIVVESGAERVRLSRSHTTTLVARLSGRAVRTAYNRAGDSEGRGAAARQGAARVSVDRRLVIRVVINTYKALVW